MKAKASADPKATISPLPPSGKGKAQPGRKQGLGVTLGGTKVEKPSNAVKPGLASKHPEQSKPS